MLNGTVSYRHLQMEQHGSHQSLDNNQNRSKQDIRERI